MERVTLVTTVLNDLGGTRDFFTAMSKQTRAPDEIIVIDAGSKDGTWELLENEAARSSRWKRSKLITAQVAGCNVARGRNEAIARANHSLIASTDVGCDWDPEWLEELTEPLQLNGSLEVVVGSWGVRELDLVGPWAKAEYALRAQSLQTSALPSTQATSRSIAFRRRVWVRLGGYPEDLTFSGDDTVFDLLLKRTGTKAASAPRIRCFWRRHERLGEFSKEQYRYFLGNGEAGITGRHFVLVGGRLGVEVVAFAVGLTTGVLDLYALCFCLIAVGLGSVSLRFGRWFRASRNLADTRVGFTNALWRVAVLDMVCRVSGLCGYARGWLRGRKRCRQCRERIRTVIRKGAPDRRRSRAGSREIEDRQNAPKASQNGCQV